MTRRRGRTGTLVIALTAITGFAVGSQFDPVAAIIGFLGGLGGSLALYDYLIRDR